MLCRGLDVVEQYVGRAVVCPVLILLLNCVLILLLILNSLFLLGRAGAMVKVQLLFALGTAAPPGVHSPAAPRAGGATGDTARG